MNNAMELRTKADAKGHTPAEMAGRLPSRVKEILSRGEQPVLESEQEFYYVGGLFAAALVSMELPNKKYQVEYSLPINICPARKLKDRLSRQFIVAHSRDIGLATDVRNKLTAVFFGWESSIKDLDEFNGMGLYKDYSEGFYLTVDCPVI